MHARTHTHTHTLHRVSAVPQLSASILSLSLHSFLPISLIPYAVTTVTGYRLTGTRNRSSIPSTAYKNFLLLHIRGLGPTQLSPYWVSHEKRPKPEPGSSYNYTPPYACLLTHRRTFSQLLLSGWCYYYKNFLLHIRGLGPTQLPPY